MTGEAGGSRARAWHCTRCTRLTIRLSNSTEPLHCDHCTGDITEIELRRPRRPYGASPLAR